MRAAPPTQKPAGGALLERAEALRVLCEALERARRGEGSVVLVTGEAGIGKTALLERFRAERQAAARFVFGACDALSTPVPLGPLRDMARGLDERVAHALALGGERGAVHSAVLDALDAPARAGERPLVLVFEDLHWSDEATLDLFQLLGRRVAERRVMVAGSLREDEVGEGHPLRRVLGELPRGRTLRVRLAPLSLAAVADLAGEGCDAERLHRISGGNPFFVSELLASPSEGVPPTVRDAVLARALRLEPAARALLAQAAVEPGRSELLLLRAALPEAEQGLDACLERGLLRLDGEEVSFRHELARLAVYDSLTPVRRRQLHARILGALTADVLAGRRLARLAHHASQAGDAGAVLQHAPAAAREAARAGAHREAAGHLRAALAFAQRLPAAARAELCEEHAYACYLTSAIAEAVRARREALALRQSLGDAEGTARNLRWLSRLLWFQGDRAASEELAERSLAALSGLPEGAEFARAASNRAQLHMLAQETAPALAWGARAAALAESLGATGILAHALNNTGTARWLAGDPAGRVELERSLRLALDGGHEEHAARAYTNLASVAIMRMEYAAAEGALAAGIAYCLERDLESWSAYMRAWLARLCFERGAWDRAAAEAEALLARPGAPLIVRQPALAMLGRVRVRRGDPGALELLDEALLLARATGELQRLVPVAAGRAEAAWLAGEPDRIAGEVRPFFELARRSGDAWSRGELALWLARAGALGRERPEVAPPYALELRGRGRPAAAAWKALGRPYEQAEALSAGDERGVAAALELFLALGARPAAERARARLRALGVRRIPRGPRPATRAHPAGLTARQVEVLALLSQDLSNAEIGRRLCVSARTVEHHVTAILARLGLGSRGEAVERARAAGWLAQDGGAADPR